MELKAREKCAMCDGTGTVYDPHCTMPDCNTAFTEGQMSWIYANPAKFLPCGHRFKYLKEQSSCRDCQGSGEIEK
jgi:hypothetical protein